MAQHPPRVVRAYPLPVEQFDHLKTYQRRSRLETNGAALTAMLIDHAAMEDIARPFDLELPELVTAINEGRVIVHAAATAKGRSTLLPFDAAEHLAAYQQACGHANQMEALIEIIRTHATICEMSRREGKPLSGISAATQIANEWHREGFRGNAPLLRPSGTSSH